MENTIHISDADKAKLKQKSLSHLPRNLGEMDAHIQILNTILPVSECRCLEGCLLYNKS